MTSSGLRVLVTGGRDFSTYEDRMWLYDGLNLLHSKQPITEIIEGGARGADLAARNWALWRLGCFDTIKITTMNADWERFGKGAGFVRNGEMAKLMPDIVLACPGGAGTAHMVSVAKAHRLRVIYLEKMPVFRQRNTLGADETPRVLVGL